MRNSILRTLVLVTVILTMMTSMVSANFEDPMGTNPNPKNLEVRTTPTVSQNNSEVADPDTQVYEKSDKVDIDFLVESVIGDGDGTKPNLDVLLAVYNEAGDLVYNYPEADFGSGDPGRGGAIDDVSISTDAALHIGFDDPKFEDVFNAAGVTVNYDSTMTLTYKVFDYGIFGNEGWTHTLVDEGQISFRIAKEKFNMTFGSTIYEMPVGMSGKDDVVVNKDAGKVVFEFDGQNVFGESSGDDVDKDVFTKVIEDGTRLYFRAVPAEGYVFLDWRYNLNNDLQVGDNGFRPNPRDEFVVDGSDLTEMPTPVFEKVESHNFQLTYMQGDRDPSALRTWRVYHKDTDNDFYPVKIGYKLSGQSDVTVITDTMTFDKDANDPIFFTTNPVGVNSSETLILYWWNQKTETWVKAPTKAASSLYELTFDPNGGEFATAQDEALEVQYSYGNDQGTEPTVEWFGYTFLGWDYPSGVGIDPIKKTGTATAQWEKKVNLWVAADDDAVVYFDGNQVATTTGVSQPWKDPTEFYIPVGSEPFIAAKAWDTNGSANIAGFRLVFNDKDLNPASFINTDNTWWVYYDAENQDAPANDTEGNVWNQKNYVSDGWVPVTVIGNPENTWANNGEFPTGSASSWIWSAQYDVPADPAIDTPVYLRSQAPMAVVTTSTEGHTATTTPVSEAVRIGTQASLTTSADMTHHVFDGWFVEGNQDPVSTNMSYNPTISGTSHFTAKYSLKQYEVTLVNATGDSGSHAALTTGLAFTANAAEGNEDPALLEWYVDGNPTGITTTDYVHPLLTADVEVEARYGMKKEATAESANTSQGTVSPSSEYVGVGGAATFTAAPVDARYYKFDYWTLNGDFYPGEAELTVPYADILEGTPFVAHFEEIATDVVLRGKVFLAVPSGHQQYGDGDIGAVEFTTTYTIFGENAPQTYEITHLGLGETTTLTAVPFGTVIEIEGVSINAAYKEAAFRYNANNPRTVTITQKKRNVTPNAVFVNKEEYFVAATYDETLVSFDKEASFYEGDDYTVSATTIDEHAVIIGVTVSINDGTPVPVEFSKDGFSYPITDFDADYAFEVIAEQHYTVSVETSGQGTATVNGESEQVGPVGTELEFIAEAAEGWKFTGWNAELPETIEGDVTYTATFEQMYTAAVVVVGEGTATVNGQASVEDLLGTPLTFEAEAANNWRFRGWDLDLPEGIEGDLVYTATFTEITTGTPDTPDVPDEPTPEAPPVVDLPEEEPLPEAAPEEDEDILDGDTPQGSPEDNIADEPLPQTGGLPIAAYAGFGLAMTGFGFRLRRKK